VALTAVKGRGGRRKGSRRKPPRHGEVAIVSLALEVDAYRARHRQATTRAIERCLADPFLLGRDVLTLKLWLETSRCGIPEPPDEADLFPLVYAARDRVIPGLAAQLDFDASTPVKQWRTCVVAAILRRFDRPLGDDAFARLIMKSWGTYLVLGLSESPEGFRPDARPRPEDRALFSRPDVQQRVRDSFLDPTLLAPAVAVASLHGIDVDGPSALPMLDRAPSEQAAPLFMWLGRNWPERPVLERAATAIDDPRFAAVRYAPFHALRAIAHRGQPDVVERTVRVLLDFLQKQARSGLGPPLDEASSHNPRLLAVEALAGAVDMPEAAAALFDIANNPIESLWIRRTAWISLLRRRLDRNLFEQLRSSDLGRDEIADIIRGIPIEYRFGDRRSHPESEIAAIRSALTELSSLDLDPAVRSAIDSAIETMASIEKDRARAAAAASSDQPAGLRSLTDAGRLLRFGAAPMSELPNYVRLLEQLRGIAAGTFDAEAATQEMTGHRMADGGPPFIIRFVLRDRLIEYRVEGNRQLDLMTTAGAVNEALAAAGETVRLARFSAGMEETLFAFLPPEEAKAIAKRAGRKLVRTRPLTVRAY